MAINKVVKQGVVKLDLTSDTVTPETLMQGVTAHNAAGESIVGTASGGGGSSVETCTVSFMNNKRLSSVEYHYVTLDEFGKITSTYDINTSGGDMTISNVVCGSFIVVNCTSNQPFIPTCGGAEIMEGTGATTRYNFKITANQGETAIINFPASQSGGAAD